MKANNYIKQLREIVNNNVLESIECVQYGVQAYGIGANECEVITKFAKINGRYYFIDRDGNKYLASRYDRAELVARDVLDNLQYASETAQEYVCKFEEKKQIAVDAAHLSMFFDFCDLLGFEVESVENHYHDNGEMLIVYRIKGAQDDAQSNETVADEQQTESEAAATTCDPSAFSRILAKVKGSARKMCERVAFVMSFIFIVSIVFFGSLFFSFSKGLDMFGIDGMARVVCAPFLLLTAGVEIAVNVEMNIIAVFDRLFPPLFNNQKPAPFVVPFTFWYSVLQNIRK